VRITRYNFDRAHSLACALARDRQIRCKDCGTVLEVVARHYLIIKPGISSRITPTKLVFWCGVCERHLPLSAAFTKELKKRLESEAQKA